MAISNLRTAAPISASSGENTNCGLVEYEPQSIEARGNFPIGGPADGHIAGGGVFPELDAQSSTRWNKVDMNGGNNTFTWHLTAPHATKEWKYYITKKRLESKSAIDPCPA
ncbi:lytic polysaccharide monooxygenase [Paenibacillus thiaminolyticus]|uniref:lytic polysaccharide monooxygenase n=1 Tax=Paenibacillus thiaminolyticus TaxID=49283 RepID=UPI0030B92BEC